MTDPEKAGELVREQLKSRTRTGYYNRNVFTTKTDNDLAESVRTYCKKQGINPNVFLNQLLTNFFKQHHD